MILLFSTDLDGTLLGHPESEQRFRRAWAAIPHERRPLLVYNTGRDLTEVRALIAHGTLPTPDVVIGGVGTMLDDLSDPASACDFRDQFDPGWNLAAINRVVGAIESATRQPPEAQHARKSSWYLDNAAPGQLQAVAVRLDAAGVRAMVVYSKNKYLDVLPANAGKGNALAWLCARRAIPLHQVLVAGDTGNDASMFLLPGVSRIVVGNALPELLAEAVRLPGYIARAAFADGVLEGLRHFGVL